MTAVTTKKGKRAASSDLTRLRHVRREAIGAIPGWGTDPNIIGSMLAAKVKDGRLTRKVGITVLVQEKFTEQFLGPTRMIPGVLHIDGEDFTTDVLQIGPLQAQTLFPPDPLLTFDGFETGTLSCFARSPYGDFGVTCAHTIAGEDRNPHSPAPIRIWSSAASQYVPVGGSGFAVSAPGNGMSGDFGFSDAALFSLEHPELAFRASQLSVVNVATVPPNTRLWGLGAMKGRRTGVVLGVDVQVGNMLVDVLIRADPPGTYRGDSGMMWRTATGECVAIHAYGENLGPGAGSRQTAAMFAERAADQLGVSFLG